MDNPSEKFIVKSICNLFLGRTSQLRHRPLNLLPDLAQDILDIYVTTSKDHQGSILTITSRCPSCFCTMMPDSSNSPTRDYDYDSDSDYDYGRHAPNTMLHNVFGTYRLGIGGSIDMEAFASSVS